MLKNSYFLLLLVLIPRLVYGEWDRVTFNDTTTMFIDTQSIKRNGDRVQVVQLMNLPLGEFSPDKTVSYKSSVTTMEYDCKKNISRTLSFRWYSDAMGKGKKVYEDKHQYEDGKLEDGSLMNAVKKKVCQ